MRVGLAQIDTRAGDLAGNTGRIAAAVSALARKGAELVVLPELAVTGYPPRDLLYDDAFVAAAIHATTLLARELSGMPPVLVGTIARAPRRMPGHPGLYDVAALLFRGRVEATFAKELLPAYDVFHEPRWFVPGPPKAPVTIAGRKVGVLVCEDLWSEGYAIDPARALVDAGAELLVCLSASPYREGVLEKRRHHARRAGAPLVYVNMAGAQDELILDGASFAMGAGGELAFELPRFEEAVGVVETDDPIAVAPRSTFDEDGELCGALVCGVRGFARKNGVKRAFLGLSGGIDSAVVACIAAEALGPKAVTAIAMPSRFTDARSTASARELATRLGIGFEVVPIEGLYGASERELSPALDRLAAPAEGDTTYENIQARLRAIVLMAFVNRGGGVLLNTSNKTELSLGYGTLYGDMAGSLSALGDVIKPRVYALARWLDRDGEVIPRFILERPPTAELAEGQVDPFDYDAVAPAVEAMILGTSPFGGPAGGPVGGPGGGTSSAYRRMIRASEHKRWQAGVILKVTERAFGTGRMVPLTRGMV